MTNITEYVSIYDALEAVKKESRGAEVYSNFSDDDAFNKSINKHAGYRIFKISIDRDYPAPTFSNEGEYVPVATVVSPRVKNAKSIVSPIVNAIYCVSNDHEYWAADQTSPNKYKVFTGDGYVNIGFFDYHIFDYTTQMDFILIQDLMYDVRKDALKKMLDIFPS